MRHIFLWVLLVSFYLPKYSLTANNIYSNRGYLSSQEKYKLYEYKLYASSF